MTISATQPAALRQVIATTCNVNLHEAHDHARLVQDLHVDSLEMAYLLQAIEEHSGVMLDGPVVMKMETVGDLIEAVCEAAGATTFSAPLPG